MYEFTNAEQLLELCAKHNEPISEIVIRYEMEFSQKPREEVIAKMRKTKDVMKEAVTKAIENPEYSAFKMAGGGAQKLFSAASEVGSSTMILNRVALRAMAYAAGTGETNSAMGRIAAFPTAGGAGVVPGALLSLAEEMAEQSTAAGKPESEVEEKLIRGLFTAAAIGIVIAEGATLSAAAGGCQAEVGAATAMAAAGVTEMRGGTPEQACNASALALKSMLGLACDPLGGLVAVPCIKRNCLGTVSAFGASDMSVAGITSFVPFDEVVQAMKSIAKMMPYQIRETALGGLAATKTGLEIRKKLGIKDSIKSVEAAQAKANEPIIKPCS